MEERPLQGGECGLLLLVHTAQPMDFKSKRVEQLEMQLDGFILALANALKAIPSISAAFQSVSPILQPPIQQEVELAMKEMKVGSTLDQALLDRPGVAEAQLALFVDYQTNVAAYEAWHAYFRQYQPRTLIAWGKNDPFFLVPGAQAYLRDLKDAELVLLDGGHFALEEHAGAVATHIERTF